MIKVFLDSSVIIAGIASSRGTSHFILVLSKKRKITVFVSSIVIDEVIRNLRKKFSEDILDNFLHYLPQSNFKKIDINKEEVTRYEGVTEEKDIHVLAGAYKSRVNYLITLDKKHLLKLKVEKFPFQIVTPREFLTRFIREKRDKV